MATGQFACYDREGERTTRAVGGDPRTIERNPRRMDRAFRALAAAVPARGEGGDPYGSGRESRGGAGRCDELGHRSETLESRLGRDARARTQRGVPRWSVRERRRDRVRYR